MPPCEVRSVQNFDTSLSHTLSWWGLAATGCPVDKQKVQKNMQICARSPFDYILQNLCALSKINCCIKVSSLISANARTGQQTKSAKALQFALGLPLILSYKIALIVKYKQLHKKHC